MTKDKGDAKKREVKCTASESKIHVSLSKLYVDGIDELIKEGVYMDRSEAVMSALQRLFKHHMKAFELVENLASGEAIRFKNGMATVVDMRGYAVKRRYRKEGDDEYTEIVEA